MDFTWQPAINGDFKTLYQANGWTNYLTDWERTQRGLQNSFTLAAFKNNQLVGLIRGVSDQATILYVQDLLVSPEHQHHGIGTALLKQMLSHFPDVGQVILTAENTEQAQQFYQKQGFQGMYKEYGTAFVMDRRN